MAPKTEKLTKKSNIPLKTHGNKSIPRYTKTVQYRRSLKHLMLRKVRKGLKLQPKPVTKPEKTVKLRKQPMKGKKAKEITIQAKMARFSTTEPARRKLVCTRSRNNPTKLRKSIKPGTVLIMLAGVFAGKRVVFLKQLGSGLLLVTGPFKLNGVPLRRVNQRYVIATSTEVDISGVKLPETVNDTFFQREKPSQKKRKEKRQRGIKPKEKSLLATTKGSTAGGEKGLSPEEKGKQRHAQLETRKELQKTIDEPILAKIDSIKHLKEYISSMFTLKKGQYPHDMIF